MSDDPHSPKYSPKSQGPYSMTGLGEDLTWKPTSSDPKFVSAAAEDADAAARRQEKLDSEKGRTAFAIAHAVGIDGSLNPVLAQPTLPSLDGAEEGEEPVMRRNSEEPLVKRAIEEVKECGRVVKEAVGKVVHGVGSGSGGGEGEGPVVACDEPLGANDMRDREDARRSDSHQTGLGGHDGTAHGRYDGAGIDGHKDQIYQAQDDPSEHSNPLRSPANGPKEITEAREEASDRARSSPPPSKIQTQMGPNPDHDDNIQQGKDHRDLASLN